jgi:hypothetical protein
MQHVEHEEMPSSDGREYPVVFDVDPPETYERAQVALRLLILALLAVLSAPLGWLFGVLFLALPAVAAIGISSRGAARYHAELSGEVIAAIRWVLSFYAYLLFLTDRFPLWSSPASLVRFEVRPTGSPSVASALGRLITTLPYALVLFVLGFGAAIAWVVGLIVVLSSQRMPDSLYGFLRGVLRWQARLLAYHASVVDEYPPFRFDTEPG